jgi:hypothetical protein
VRRFSARRARKIPERLALFALAVSTGTLAGIDWGTSAGPDWAYRGFLQPKHHHRSAMEQLSNLLSLGDHHLGGTVIMTTATSTGYCMKCKAQREIKNAKQITMKNGRPATEGTCPVCSTKIFKIGAIK